MVRKFLTHEFVAARLGLRTTPRLTNFDHMLETPFRVRQPLNGGRIKVAPLKDRIKFWNIVPGDQIRLRHKDTDKIREVLSINRLLNRVHVKGTVEAEYDKTASRPEPKANKNYPYSMCQLFVGNYEFPSKEPGGSPEVVPVFAKRLATSRPRWVKHLSRWHWDRFATATEPPVPWLRGQRTKIPWPKEDIVAPPPATRYDTLREELVKVTYKPPVFPQTMKGPIPRPPSEADYLGTIFKPRQNSLFPEVPTPGIEVYLHKELSNPHSRAKKQARWQAHQAYKKNLLQEYISVELKNLNGRTVGDAKAEAAWKWRQRLVEEEREQKKMRWKMKASIAKTDRKSERKERKQLKQRERLTAMVLKEEPNQVIPKDMR